MGADRAVLVQDPRFDRADGMTRARALAAVAKNEGADLIFVGKYGVGTDEGLTGPMIAEILGWPHVAAVSKLELRSDGFTAERDIEGAVEVHEGSLPVVLTCEKGLNQPRYASLKGIMQAKKKKIDLTTPEEIGLNPEELGDDKKLIWESLELPPARAAGRLIDGTPEESAQELARLLREEAKVI